MKIKSLILVAAVFAAASITASAQIYWPISRGGTANIKANTNQTYSAAVNLRDARLVAIEERFAMCASGTDNVEVHLDGTLDGSSWIADAVGTFTNAATGTTAQTNTAFYDCGGYVGARARIVNASATVAVTNIYLAVTLKVANAPATLTGISVSAFTNTDLTASRAMVSDANKAIASSTTTATELGYVHNVTSSIQTQIGTKAPITVGGNIVTFTNAAGAPFKVIVNVTTNGLNFVPQ